MENKKYMQQLLTDRDKEFLQEINNLIVLNYSSFILEKRTGNYNIKINFLKGECVNFKEFLENTKFLAKTYK